MSIDNDIESKIQQILDDNNGYGIFEALFDLEGNIVQAKKFEGNYGWTWGIFPSKASVESTTKFVKYFNESKAEKEQTFIKNNAKKGYYVGTIETDAQIKFFEGWPEIRKLDPYDYKNCRILDNGQAILKELGLIA